jgi:chromosome partitioning protein
MGKVVMFGGEKGGAGKSTTATNIATYLAHEGFDVMLLDADKQCTSSKWITRRNRAKHLPVIHNVQKLLDIYDTTMDLANRYDWVIVDAGGRDSKELRTGLAAADLLYSPLRASQADVETLDVVDELVSMAKALNPVLRCRLLLCMVPATSINTEVREARELFDSFARLPISGCTIADLKAYRDALKLGLGVIELKNTKAKAEVHLLGQELLEILK